MADLFLKLLRYYRSSQAAIGYHRLKNLTISKQAQLFQATEYVKYHRVQILAYCLMPNHYHLLVAQLHDGGVVSMMRSLLNSFTQYYNKSHKRFGPLFQPQFKAKSIYTDEVLTHVSRYIHLNPYSSGIVSTFNDLFEYKYSSINEYCGHLEDNLCSKQQILALFGNSGIKYQEFLQNNADYQRRLNEVKRLMK